MTELTAHCAAQEIAPGTGAPEMVHLLPLGKIVARDGRRFDLRDPEAVIAASMGKGVDLVIDCEHQSEERRVNGPAPAAGWIKALELRPDGIWGRVDWTAQARELIASRAYRYLSPVFRFSAGTGVVRRLTGAGLIHQPALELTALAREEPAMPQSPDFAARLAAALGLPEGSDASAVEDSFFALVEQMAALIAKGDPVATNSEHPDPAQYAPLAAMRELLKERNTAVAALRESEVERRVKEAVMGGYIAPGMKDWATALCRDNPVHFDAFLSAAMPAYAHFFKPIIAGRAPPMAGGAAAASPEAQAICAQLDLDPKALG